MQQHKIKTASGQLAAGRGETMSNADVATSIPQPDLSTQPPTPIEVLNIRPCGGGGNLRAFATVRVGALVIADCRIVQQPGQRPWVSMPVRERGGRFLPIVRIVSDSLKTRINEVVLAAWESKGGAQ